MAALPHGEDWKKGTENDLSTIPNCWCPNCQRHNATTTLLPTKLPLFREYILVNLTCPDCHFRNAEVQFGGEIQPRGETISLHVTSEQDLNRQVVKSDSCSLFVPQLELEIPPSTQRGSISTLEGMLQRAADNLEALQPERLRLGDVDNFRRCRKVIQELRRYIAAVVEEEDDDDENDINREQRGNCQNPHPRKHFLVVFDVVLDDPAGNSFIENLHAPHNDPQLTFVKYARTATQDMALGLQPASQALEAGCIDNDNPDHKSRVNGERRHDKSHSVDIVQTSDSAVLLGKEEGVSFVAPCPNCRVDAQTDMCITDIPHFQQVILMCLLCEKCGYRSNEIKAGGPIPRHGTQITLTIQTPDDLTRDVLKSDTAGLSIPELELELQEGGLGGVYTSIEGLLKKLHHSLTIAHPFGLGDAAEQQHSINDGGDYSNISPSHAKYHHILNRLWNLAHGETLPATLIISDPLSNSFVGPIRKDAEALALQAEQNGNRRCFEEFVDIRLTTEKFERSFDQNEHLGLNDIKTENYATGDDGVASQQYHSTDKTTKEEPQRIHPLANHGLDHPHPVAPRLR